MNHKIKAYRKEQGMSQQALSEKVKVSRQTINAIENNKYDPTLTLAFNLANVLNTSVDDLFSH